VAIWYIFLRFGIGSVRKKLSTQIYCTFVVYADIIYVRTPKEILIDSGDDYFYVNQTLVIWSTLWPKNAENAKIAKHLQSKPEADIQGNQIGRIFAYLAIVFFRHFLKITKLGQIYLFSAV
jgi:hypothetical protein